MRASCLLPILLCAALTGCNSMGASAVSSARAKYTDALAETQSEQMLQNLVRLRYLDMPMFLEVTSVNTQYELRGAADASITGVFGNSLSEYGNRAGTGVSIVERPTITYAPLQGEAFVKRVMSPMGLENLSLMIRSGWRLEHVLVVCCQSLGPATNAPRATGPAQDADTDNTEFVRIVRLLGEAQRSRGGRFGVDDDGGYVMEFDLGNPHTVEWLEAMGVKPTTVIPIVHGVAFSHDVISIQTRSLLGAMFYLSLGIDIPPEHMESGAAPIPPAINYREITKDFFTVRSAGSEPPNAAIKCEYRGKWFFIDDADHRSKATFALLTLLFSLQSGSRDAVRPAVTIPLN